MPRLLITGGAGFVGSNLVHYWLETYPSDRVVVLDALTYAGNRSSLASLEGRESFRFVEGNICDTACVEELLRAEQIDRIVNCAAESHVDRSIAGPDIFIETNVVGAHTLLKAARRVWLEERRVPNGRFHQVSTDEVYGSLETPDPAFTESSPFRPNSAYAASKAAADHLVRAYHRTYGLSVSTSHCSNNYGRYQFPEKLIPSTIVRLLDGRELPVYGDGHQIRDWMHVRDHCVGLSQVLANSPSGGAYNLGGRCERENIDVVQSLCRIADNLFRADLTLRQKFPHSAAVRGESATTIRHVTDRPGHDRRYAIDCSRACRELGFAPSTNMADGLHRTFLWYIRHESWWRPIVGGHVGSQQRAARSISVRAS